MSSQHRQKQTFQISHDKLLAIVHAFIANNSGREDDDHPLPPGPWDPIIRFAVEQSLVFSPRPEPWKNFGDYQSAKQIALASIFAKHPEIFDAISGDHSYGDEFALNPQPLPPRFAFMISLAQAVIGRAELIQDIASATSKETDQHGITLVGGYTNKFVEEFCATGFKIKWPFPSPPPPWWIRKELSGIDLLVIATQFEQAAKQTVSPVLRQHMADASEKFLETGLLRLE